MQSYVFFIMIFFVHVSNLFTPVVFYKKQQRKSRQELSFLVSNDNIPGGLFSLSIFAMLFYDLFACDKIAGSERTDVSSLRKISRERQLILSLQIVCSCKFSYFHTGHIINFQGYI
jgi:hypothetical protein